MRLDKFLKLARLVKRRTVAQEMIEVGAVRINGRQCKPSAEVRVGDSVEIAYPSRFLSLEVLCADEAALKRMPPEEAWSLREERRVDPSERPW
ncbi:MAG TPA: RNA-binding S4 domain-containing protein [Synergistales bacterium]|jgi:ribosomal 50S subunit-recycling heat shock protein|nr:RNA-binding S4 domain-containing protein [Synergistaceae bacterium]PKL02877.1 MAG: RNA-binding protein [Synergistetes bacterium HGW-Synergistetes-2]HOO87437.1 RNA-binding S4 domain-containing protein [Synergistales bacterium]HRV97180.1 RNA-binding S4 domain-containing protein [Aminobacteriaceae bacterium]NLD96567.1 RNA-binding S4 domain-containing protein [Synergistaceae bacterium]